MPAARYPAARIEHSELQHAALALYRQSGYLLLGEEVAETASNKTVGGGIRRYYFARKPSEIGAFHLQFGTIGDPAGTG